MARNRYSKKSVWFAILADKFITEGAAQVREDLVSYSKSLGYQQIRQQQQHIHIARNEIAAEFMNESRRSNDTLVMLDTDHQHPQDIVEILVNHNVSVVGALCFRRGEPYDPQVYIRKGGKLIKPAEWGPGLMQCEIVGFGAVAIQRRAFEQMEAEGYPFPWFRNTYIDNENKFEGEDFYFCRHANKAGVPIYCDMDTISPHLMITGIDDRQWKQTVKKHRTGTGILVPEPWFGDYR